MLRSIIFDMDGVLVDSMPSHADAWLAVSREIGADISREEIYEIEGANHIQGIQWLFGKAGKEVQPYLYEEIKRRKVEFFSANARVYPFEGMFDCLSSLKKHFSLAVVTGSDRCTVKKITDSFFADIFDIFVCSEDVCYGKPFPDPYLKAVELLGMRKEECIVIENAPMGVESAKRAGLFCVGVPTYVPPSRLSAADIVLDDHKSLYEYLLRLIPSEN
ncbi:MAG: HAD family phosphatase [Methanomethylovorans sp.]|jgi:HAD superfamily hydrolase (TIGR01509 family)|nr:HAD family phosphatase [Methanomethylovorans sp.]